MGRPSMPVSFVVMLAASGAAGFGLYDAFMPVSGDACIGVDRTIQYDKCVADALHWWFTIPQTPLGVAVLAGGVTVLRLYGPGRLAASVNQ